jgi:outer membrane protein W
MRPLLLTLLLSAPACGEIFSYGLIVGTPLTDVTQTTTIAGLNYLKNSTLFTIGPTFQVNLPAGFRVEIDALYRPVAYQIATSPTTTNVSASQWRFPVLLQYHIGKHSLLKPYAEVGLSFDTLSNLEHAAGLVSTQPGAIVKTTDAGLVLGFGADIKVPFLRISPEIRYTRQFNSEFEGISELNQAEFLVGIRF